MSSTAGSSGAAGSAGNGAGGAGSAGRGGSGGSGGMTFPNAGASEGGAPFIDICGDGIVSGGEACDDGNANNDDGCVHCTLAKCGDGFVNAQTEECDDGNTLEGDTCPAICRVGARAIWSGDSHTCAVGQNGVLKCWGYNGDCQLGSGTNADTLGDAPNEMGLSLPRVDLGAERVDSVVGGMVFGCALLGNNTVKCWGDGVNGVFASGTSGKRGCEPATMGLNLSNAQLGQGVIIVQLMAGYRHVCALTNQSRVKCWGFNLAGQVGIGDYTGIVDVGTTPELIGDSLPFVPITENDLPVAQIGGGYAQSCALFADGRLKCWGQNVFGELGIGLAGLDNAFIGWRPEQMSEHLPFVKLPAGTIVAQVAGGDGRTCVMTIHGAVLCWGDGIGDSPTEMGDALEPVPLGAGRTARALAMGRKHQCVILDTGAVKCWGIASPALGLGDTLPRLDRSVLGDQLPAVDLGTGRTALAISAGAGFSCALLDNHSVKCWGYGGALGQGDTLTRGDQPDQMGDALPAIDLRF